MALDSYANLQASVINWADRSGDSTFSAAVPDFIAMFESQANQDAAIRTIFNKTSTAISTVAGQNYVSLPSDFLAPESLINTVGTGFDYEVISPFGTAAALYTQYPSAAAAQNRPKGFLVLTGKMELAPVPDAVYPLVLYYFQKIPALSSTNTTNWLLTNFPNLYLFGSLVAAEAFLGTDDPRIKTWGQLYDNYIEKLTGSTERSLYGASALTAKVDAVA